MMWIEILAWSLQRIRLLAYTEMDQVVVRDYNTGNYFGGIYGEYLAIGWAVSL